jgi:hypothetical protein
MVLITFALFTAACAPNQPAPEPEDTLDQAAVSDTETATSDTGAAETSTDATGAPPGAASVADEASGITETVDEGGTGAEPAPEGFNNENLPEDWPEEVPVHPEIYFQVYEWDGNHMHAEATSDFDFYRAHNYHVNFTAAGWEHAREDEWVRTGDDRVLWLTREGMTLEVNVHKLDNGGTYLILDLDKE